jgi:NAD(P)-dependent dehydrogenase (short-subunit alcohol dehydrogenase family)
MSVNAEGVFFGLKCAIPMMRDSGADCAIVNISSIASHIGMSDNIPYSASKGAVRSLTKSAALYCAREKTRIRVNSVHPGFVVTDMVRRHLGQEVLEARRSSIEAAIPLGRLATPEDIADGVLFLASEESSYVTAAELVIDGGILAQ